MADREITERVRIDVDGRRDLRDAATEARRLRESLGNVAGGASSARAALQSVAGAAGGASRSGLGALNAQLDEAQRSAGGLAKSLHQVAGEAGGAGAAAGKLGGEAGGRGAERLTGALKSLLGGGGIRGALSEFAGPEIQSTVEGLGSSFAGLAGPIGIATAAVGVLKKAAEVAIAAIKIAIDLAIRGSLKAIEATSQKSGLLTGLELLTRSRKEAERLFDLASDIGDKLGQQSQDTVAALTTLLSKGFKAESTKDAVGALDVLKALADIKTISPGANLDALTKAIADIRSKGVLAFEELRGQLGEAFDVSAVEAQLSKRLGKSIDEVRKLVSAGKVDANTGLLAFLDAVKEKTGLGLGEAAEKAANSVPKLLERLEGAFTKLFDSVDLAPLQNALKAVVDLLKGPTGQAIKDGVSKVFGNLFKALFGGFEGAEGQAKLERTMQGIAQILDAIGDGIAEHEGDIRAVIDAFVMLIQVTASLIGILTGAVDPFKQIENGAVGVTTAINGMVASVTAALSPLSSAGPSIGASLGEGLAQGILGSIPSAVSAALDLSGAVISATRGPAGFDAHSPSDAFKDIGRTLPQGLAAGAANDNSARTAMEDLAGRTTDAARGGVDAAPSPRANSGDSGGGGGVVFNVNLTLPPGTSPEAAGQLGEAFAGPLRAMVRQEIGRFVRRRGEAA